MTIDQKLSPAEHECKAQILTQPRPARTPRPFPDAVVLKWDRTFILSDMTGEVPMDGPHGLGLYFEDCRFLDGYTLIVNGATPDHISEEVTADLRAMHYLAVKVDDPSAKDAPRSHSVIVKRERHIRGAALLERITVHNHGMRRSEVDVALAFRAGFEDVFVVRGFVAPASQPLDPRIARDRVELRSRGRDGIERALAISFSPAPDRLDGSSASFHWSLDAQEERAIQIELAPSIGPLTSARGTGDGPRWSVRHQERTIRTWIEGATTVTTSNALFDRAMARALLDLRVLASHRGGRRFFAAGIPWFATLFGRDAALTAMQTLPYSCLLAHDTLHLLASLQATATDTFRDAEPGKILHELRVGELANANAIPQSPAYYGSVDATALFVILVARYIRWSGDAGILRSLRANIEAALEWLAAHADHDGDGFHDYTGKYGRGLVNQGWKDSGNSILRPDGSLPEPPIALPEVQAYAYRAWRELADVYRTVGQPRPDLDRRAEAMRERFEREFWSEPLGMYALAIAHRERIDLPASNAGQVLWGGIASTDRGRAVAARLMRDDMFSGWGVRTLSSDTPMYDPVGYHLGTVWPHDNALIARGMRKYGCDDEALRIFTGLADAAMNARDGRLPELFAGFPRTTDAARPVDYPNACRPQAWAAGALPFALWTMLGLAPDALSHRLLLVRPRLPEWLAHVELSGLRIGPARVDLRFDRGAGGSVEVAVTNAAGDLDVRVTDEPAEAQLRF